MEFKDNSTSNLPPASNPGFSPIKTTPRTPTSSNPNQNGPRRLAVQQSPPGPS